MVDQEIRVLGDENIIANPKNSQKQYPLTFKAVPNVIVYGRKKADLNFTVPIAEGTNFNFNLERTAIIFSDSFNLEEYSYIMVKNPFEEISDFFYVSSLEELDPTGKEFNEFNDEVVKWLRRLVNIISNRCMIFETTLFKDLNNFPNIKTGQTFIRTEDGWTGITIRDINSELDLIFNKYVEEINKKIQEHQVKMNEFLEQWKQDIQKYAENVKQYEIVRIVTQTGHGFVFEPVMYSISQRKFVKAVFPHGADGIAVRVDDNNFRLVWAGRVEIPATAKDTQQRDFVLGEYYFLGEGSNGGIQREKPDTYYQHLFQVMYSDELRQNIADVLLSVPINQKGKRWDVGEAKTTVNDIEELKMSDFPVGKVVEVLGYYSAGDGAGHKRIIKAEDDGSGVQLSNKLWANIVHNGEVNVSWFGAKYNSLESAKLNYTNLLKAINYNKAVIINGNLYIEQNGDNAVISENLILKGNNEGKIIVSNFENKYIFRINKNLNEISLCNLKIESSKELTFSTFIYLSGMIKVNKFLIKNNSFETNEMRLSQWGELNYVEKPDLNINGFNEVILERNTIKNSLTTFIMFDDVIYKKIEVVNNYINNFYYMILHLGTTNEITFVNEVTNNKLLTKIIGNTVKNDDDFIFDSTAKTSYYCFVLVEAKLSIYKNNYVEGIKSKTDIAVYDAYFNVETLYYQNNEWKNNLCFFENKDLDTAILMKSKSSKNRFYFSNKFILEEEWLNKFAVSEKGRWVKLDVVQSLSDEIVINDNYVDVPYLCFFTSTPTITNYKLTDNLFKSKKTGGSICMCNAGLSDIKNSEIIISNNNFSLGSIEGYFSFISTNKEDVKDSIYKNIIIENNSVSLETNASSTVYLFGGHMFADNVKITNNNFYTKKIEKGIVFSLFEQYKKINAINYVFDNNIFSCETYDNSYIMNDVIVTAKTFYQKFKITNENNYSYLGHGYYTERTEITDIPEKKYEIVLNYNSDGINKKRIFKFSLLKENGIEKIKSYNTLGQEEISETDFTKGLYISCYLFDEFGKITNESIFIIIKTQGSIQLLLNENLNAGFFETEIKII